MAQLNEEQKKAVLQMDNAVVAAGAGSGKTFVLAQRYSYCWPNFNFDFYK